MRREALKVQAIIHLAGDDGLVEEAHRKLAGSLEVLLTDLQDPTHAELNATSIAG